MIEEPKPDLVVGVDLGQTCTGAIGQPLLANEVESATDQLQVSRTAFLLTDRIMFDGSRNGPDEVRQRKIRSPLPSSTRMAAISRRPGVSRPRPLLSRALSMA